MTQSIPIIWYLAPISSILSLIVAYFLSKKLLSADEGTDRMIEIAGYVKDGAMAYLKRQYKVVAIVVVVFIFLLSSRYRSLIQLMTNYYSLHYTTYTTLC